MDGCRNSAGFGGDAADYFVGGFSQRTDSGRSAATRGKRLNASQTDLVSKIKGFLKDAREAAQAGDWARARNLAKKAQVLSEELVRSV